MSTDSFLSGIERLSTEKLARMARHAGASLKMEDKVWSRLKEFRSVVEEKASGTESCYGVNTGFGFLADVKIAPDKLEQLQKNLIRSHACGTGDFARPELVRALLILRIHTFSLGFSGVTPDCLKTLLGFLEHDILPMIPMQGSVGASGDLAPLAHLALGLMGEGSVLYKGEKMPAIRALEMTGVRALEPSAKEGLSLINGTHFMTSMASLAVERAKILSGSADIVAALSLDAFKGSVRAFDPRIHEIRPQSGQKLVAENILKLLDGEDEIRESHKNCGKVQDPYSFRCIPQVHGATRDAVKYVEDRINIELNSVTDNPLVFPGGELISGGNFHGQPIALSMDFLGLAISELGSISERRIEKLTNPGLSSLPAFITEDSGLNSGYMIPHVVAAALASENKSLCHPASADSIPTSADKEDHVSMGPIAARQALKIIDHVSLILGIELLAACQAIDLMKPLKPTPILSVVYNKVREMSPYMATDRSLSEDFALIADWIKDGKLCDLIQDSGFALS